MMKALVRSTALGLILLLPSSVQAQRVRSVGVTRQMEVMARGTASDALPPASSRATGAANGAVYGLVLGLAAAFVIDKLDDQSSSSRGDAAGGRFMLSAALGLLGMAIGAAAGAASGG